ncbi:hypothetical protein ES705_29193 [subsurface metagenome]
MSDIERWKTEWERGNTSSRRAGLSFLLYPFRVYLAFVASACSMLFVTINRLRETASFPCFGKEKHVKAIY